MRQPEQKQVEQKMTHGHATVEEQHKQVFITVRTQLQPLQPAEKAHAEGLNSLKTGLTDSRSCRGCDGCGSGGAQHRLWECPGYGSVSTQKPHTATHFTVSLGVSPVVTAGAHTSLESSLSCRMSASLPVAIPTSLATLNAVRGASPVSMTHA